jgi:hypothetical protein
MSRLARRPHANHQAAADKCRAHPGRWQPVGEYRSTTGANSIAWSIRNGRGPDPSGPAAYTPAGAYEAQIQRTETGYLVSARYTATAPTTGEDGPIMAGPVITYPHTPYIDAIEAALTEAQMQPEQADAFVEDSYDVAYLRGVITLTPETSGVPAERYQHGLILVWDWHTGADEDYDRGPIWQWAPLNEDGATKRPLEELPVPGWASPAIVTAQAAATAYTGKPIPIDSEDRLDKVTAAEAAIRAWEQTEGDTTA